MPEITEAELKAQIRKSEFSNFYFLYGEEKYMIGYYSTKLIAAAGGSAFETFNVQRFDGETADVDRIAAAAEALPFMAERKCVAVSDFNAGAARAREAGKLEELLGGIPETTVLLFSLPTLTFDPKKDTGWKKFIARANAAGCTVNIKKRTADQLVKFLCSGAEKRGCSLSRRDAERIVGFCGDDLHTLFGELEKLCSFAGSGEITPDQIDRVVVKNLEARVFDLSKAILAGNYSGAYTILDQLFSQNEEPTAILAVLSSAYLDMYRVRVSVESGLGASEPAKDFDYARKEFRLKNAERDSRRFSTQMLRRCVCALLEADAALKGARGDRRLVMEKLIARLLLIAEKGKTV
jgi:DNA polymerase-3 subunit delta